MATTSDEQTAIDHFREIRWRNGAFCLHCKSIRVYHFSDNHAHCRKRLSFKISTIFEDSKILLPARMLAIWPITFHKMGIASTQMAKDLSVTQKRAWRMAHSLRYAFRTQSFNRPLDGIVEVEEPSIGSKEKNEHAYQRAGGKEGGKGKVAVLRPSGT